MIPNHQPLLPIPLVHHHSNLSSNANQNDSAIPLDPLPSRSVRPDPQSERKRNDKNKFINKLKQLSSEPGSQGLTFHKSLPSGESMLDRRERNKMAARQSRDRKKLYIKLMESRIQGLEAEVGQAESEIEAMRMEIFNVQMHQDSKRKELKNRQMHIIKKLQGLIHSHGIDERNNQINICLDSIVYRVGAMGNERKAALYKLYNNLINFSQPALYRYILWSAVTRQHLFRHHSDNVPINQAHAWCAEIAPIAEACSQGRQEILNRIGQNLTQHKLHFQRNNQNLIEVRGEIEKRGQILDNIVNEIRQVLTPEQVAHLILFVERHQFKQQVRLFENEEEQIQGRKRVKVEEEPTYIQ